MAGSIETGRFSSPVANSSAAAWTGASPASRSARRTSGCPPRTAPTRGVSRSRGSAAPSGSAKPGTSTSSGMLGQPQGRHPRCCRTPARSGPRNGVPARPPAAWAFLPASPTRTTTAGWRLRGGSAWPDPARLCRQHPQRGEKEVVCSRAHPGHIPEPTPHPGKESGTSPWHCGFRGD